MPRRLRRYRAALLLLGLTGAAAVLPRSTAPDGPPRRPGVAEQTLSLEPPVLEQKSVRDRPRAGPMVPSRRPLPMHPSYPVHHRGAAGAGGPRHAAPPALPADVVTVIPAGDDRSASASHEGASLLEVQVGRLARRVLKVYAVGDRLLVPLSAWLHLVEIRHEVRGARITGRLEPSGRPYVVDGDSMLARTGGKHVPLDAEDLRVLEGELYVAPRLLATLFGVASSLDAENAALVIHEVDSLPIARRLRRERLRAVEVKGESAVSGSLVHRGADRHVPGVVATYEVRATSHGTDPDYDLGMATGVLGGSAALRTSGALGGSARAEGSWSRAWPGNPWLTQLRLGDGSGSGPRSLSSRGLYITNAAISRTVLVEDLPFAGTLPPDWSIEAYRAGELVGFDSVGSSGRYALTLPVHYGENPVEFVAYGPFGEVRTFDRTFRALPSMVPAHKLEYALSGGACRSIGCEGVGNLDLRYGASRRLTVAAGIDQTWGATGGARGHPYAAVIGAPTNALGVELEAAADLLYRASFRLEPTTALRLTADYLSYAAAPASSPLVPPGLREQWRVYGRAGHGRSGATLFEVQAGRTLTDSHRRDDARVGAVLRVEHTILRPYVRAEREAAQAADRTHGYLGLEVTALPRPALGPVLGGVWVQGQVEAGAGAITSAAVTLARNLGATFRIEAGTRWDASLDRPTFLLSLVSQLRAVRTTSLVTAAASESPRVHQSIAGSVSWSSVDRSPQFSAEPALDRGGIGGLVFIDLDGDGRHQPDEPPAPGTTLLVGNRPVSADAAGKFSVWGVAPWEEVLVTVDTTTLASPWWVPAYPASAVMPRPGLAGSLEVPLLMGAVVEGSLVLEDGASGRIRAPLAVTLIARETGARTSVETFSDGSFYRMGLRPGHYAATVADSVLRPLGVQADTVHFEVPLTPSAEASGPTVRDLHIRLSRRS